MKIIHQLEESLGVTLFTRTHQGIIPTDEADYLYIEMKPLIDKPDHIKQNLVDAPMPKKTIRFYQTCGIMSILSLDFIEAFEEEYPEIHLEVLEYEDELIHKAIRTQQADIGIMSAPILDNTLNTQLYIKIKQQMVVNTSLLMVFPAFLIFPIRRLFPLQMKASPGIAILYGRKILRRKSFCAA